MTKEKIIRALQVDVPDGAHVMVLKVDPLTDKPVDDLRAIRELNIREGQFVFVIEEEEPGWAS